MLRKILSNDVALVESESDVAVDTLYQEELALVARAVPARQREFATGRWAARSALLQLGIDEGPLLTRPDRGPQWPPQVVGAITHCAGYRAAAVALRSSLDGLGIDAELHAPLPPGVIEIIASPPERRQLASLAAAHRDIAWDRLLFSMKESIYKAWAPQTGVFLDFTEATIDLRPDGTMTASISNRSPCVATGQPLTVMEGRWASSETLLVTAVAHRCDHSGAVSPD